MEKTHSELLDEVKTLRRELSRLFGVGRVPERRRINAHLFKDLIDESNDAVFIIDPESCQFISVNSKACSCLGYSLEELLTMKVMDVREVQPGGTSWEELVENVGRGGGVHEGLIRRKDGTTFPVEVSIKVITHGEDSYIVAIARDISERKQKKEEQERLYKELEGREERRTVELQEEVEEHRRTEEALRKSEERYLSLISNIPYVTWIAGFDGKTIFISENVVNVYGYTQEEIYESPLDLWFGRIHPEDTEAVSSAWRSLFEEGTPYDIEYRIKSKDGEWIWLGDRCVTTYEEDGVRYGYGIFSDITEKKLADEALKESEELFRQMAENINKVFWIESTSLDKMLYVSPAYEEIWGRSCKSLYESPNDWLEAIHPEDKERVKKAFTKLSAAGFDEEYRIIRPDGSEKWIRDAAFPVRDSEGNIYRIAGFASDITESREALDALKSERDFIDNAINTQADTFFVFAPSTGRALRWNRAFNEVTGYSDEEIKKLKAPDSYYGGEDLKKAADAVSTIIEKGKVTVELSLITKDGSLIPTEYTASIITDKENNPTHIISIGRDIRYRRAMEAELLKVQKLESLGILAGGIAHDFNNLLTIILGNISLLKSTVGEDDKLYKKIVDSEKASLYARELTQQLLTFAKGGEPIKVATSLSSLVEEASEFTLHGSSIDLKLDIEEDLLPVDVDKGQISQVLNNIMINALQAMEDGGTIKVGVKNSTIGPINNLPIKGGEYILISIEDEGIGIPAETMPNIFDPYFTTKDKGSGLGLASAFSIIKKHGGHIGVESYVGVGTTINIYLPTSKSGVTESREAGGSLAAGSGRVLIMDDVVRLREFLKECLNHIGYECEVAGDGVEAINMYNDARARGEPFDVVIMDLTIKGGMGGKEAIRELLEIDPNTKAIVSSGYSNDPVMADYGKYGFSGVMPKPYTIKEIGDVLGKVLRVED